MHTLEVTYLVDGKTLYTTTMENKTDEQMWDLRNRIIKDTDFIRGNNQEEDASPTTGLN